MVYALLSAHLRLRRPGRTACRERESEREPRQGREMYGGVFVIEPCHEPTQPLATRTTRDTSRLRCTVKCTVLSINRTAASKENTA
jgi:hypothetical protein